jgi:O-6-methylguanine DNA methyltransferase
MRDRRKILSSILKDKRFSSFEKAVYKAISTIPRGEVRSYGWVARKIGSPHAARAVGNALNKNPYPGPIPCHRIIRSDGSIGGYAKGTRAKRRLLKREGVGIISNP